MMALSSSLVVDGFVSVISIVAMVGLVQQDRRRRRRRRRVQGLASESASPVPSGAGGGRGMSSGPPFKRARSDPPSWFASLAKAIAPGRSARRVWWEGVAAAVLGLVLVIAVGGIGLGVVMMTALSTALGVVVHVGQARRLRQVETELPAVLEAMAGSLRSGTSVPLALHDAGGRARGLLGEDLRSVTAATIDGTPLPEALDRWRAARPLVGVRLTVAALALAIECGGHEARTIDGVAATLNDRLAVDREAVALSSQARASAGVVMVAPICFVALAGASDPSVWTFFVRTPIGFACLVLGLVLDTLGGAWMWRVAGSRL